MLPTPLSGRKGGGSGRKGVDEKAKVLGIAAGGIAAGGNATGGTDAGDITTGRIAARGIATGDIAAGGIAACTGTVLKGSCGELGESALGAGEKARGPAVQRQLMTGETGWPGACRHGFGEFIVTVATGNTSLSTGVGFLVVGEGVLQLMILLVEATDGQ